MDDVTLRAQLVDEASRPLEELGKTATTTAGKIEKSSKREATAAEKAAAAVEGSHKRTRKSYDKTEKAAGKAGSEGGRKWGANMSAAVDASKSKAAGAANKVAGKMGEALKSKAGAIGAAVGVAIGGAIAAAIQSETAKTNLEIKTGTLNGGAGPGESLPGEVGTVQKNLYDRGFGADAAEVGNLVDSIARIPGVWDEGVDSAASFGAELSTISGAFEQEASGIGQTIETMMSNGMASNGSAALDMITKTMQNASPLVRDEILENVTEYAKHYDQMGLSSEQMFGLILKGSENGIIGVDKMGDAIKELGIRATDGSKTSVAAIESLGLKPGEIMDGMTKGGDAGAKAFDQVVTGLQKIKDPSDQAAAAVALFGTPLEDLGVHEIPAFLDALSSGKTGLKDWEGAAQEAADAVENGPAQQFEVLKRSALTSFSEMGAQAMPYLMPLLSFMQQWAPVLAPIAIGLGIVAAAVGVVAGATMAWNIVMAANPAVLIIAAIVLAIAGLVAGFVWAYENVKWFRDGVDGAISGIRAAFEGIVSWWNTSLLPVLQNVGSWFNTYIVSPIKTVVDWIATAIDKMGGLTGLMGTVGDFISNPLGGLGLAGGGVIPGYAPGVDSVPAVLSPGEGVLVPEAVRALGADWVYAMNREHSSRSPGTAQRFAGGGVVDGYAPGSDTVSALLSPGEGVLVPELVRALGEGWVYRMNALYSGRRGSGRGSSVVAASQKFAGGGVARPGPRSSAPAVVHNNVTVKVQGSLASGVTVADIEAAVGKALATSARRSY